MWILIITFAFSNMQGVWKGGAGYGGAGIAMAEFSSEGKCKAAGYKWELSITSYKSEIKDAAKWVCVPK
jgi:hypothetical protein